jgi:hypothetical protein
MPAAEVATTSAPARSLLGAPALPPIPESPALPEEAAAQQAAQPSPRHAEREKAPPPAAAAVAAPVPRSRQVVLDGGTADADEETAPVVLSRLAQKVQKGRQSLAPHKVRRAARRPACPAALLP